MVGHTRRTADRKAFAYQVIKQSACLNTLTASSDIIDINGRHHGRRYSYIAPLHDLFPQSEQELYQTKRAMTNAGLKWRMWLELFRRQRLYFLLYDKR